MEAMSFFIGEDVSLDEILTLINSDKPDRIRLLGKDKILITGFIGFQYGALSQQCKPHLPVIKLLKLYGLDDDYLIEESGTSVKSFRKRLTESAKRQIFEEDDYQCQYCGDRPGAESLDVDHIIALTKGGLNDPDNLITACKKCNSKKYDFDAAEYIKKLGITPLNNLFKKLERVSNKGASLKEKEKDKEEEKEEGGVGETKFVVPEMQKVFVKHNPGYPASVEHDFHALRSIYDFLLKFTKDTGQAFTLWEKISLNISSGFYSGKSLKTISSHIQNIYQETLNPIKKPVNGTVKPIANSKNAGALELLEKARKFAQFNQGREPAA
jgi:5-methylcytosine-specific restriction protein A